MHKFLVISGPTATGKTKLALHLAKLFGGELISADSRQVYKEMDIGTGKEIPSSFSIQYSEFRIEKHRLPYYTNKHIKIWGYDVIQPDEEWSAAHFVKFANRLIPKIQKQNKLPIVVGGTGLYIKNLLHPPQTLFIPPDQKLRQQLEKLSLTQLQTKLRRVSPNRFNQMNQSDRQNPRRLIRAIEVVKFAKLHAADKGFANFNPDTLHIGLTSPIKAIDRRIKNRVKSRLKQGLEPEIKNLVKKYGWNSVLSSTIAYQEWRLYFENKIPLKKVIETWTTHETQYARNQLTWFKKQPDIHWFNIAAPGFPDNIVSQIKQWYYH